MREPPAPDCGRGAHYWRETIGGSYDRAANTTVQIFCCVNCGVRYEAKNGDRSFLSVGDTIHEVRLT